MDRLLEMSAAEYEQRAMELVQARVRQIGDAINRGRTGSMIDDCEMEVKREGEQLTRELLELGSQMRIDSTESSFSPSAGRKG